MPTLQTEDVSLHYDTYGDRRKPPLLLLAGLGGIGASFGTAVTRFAADHFVIVPDHRGTGRSSRPQGGYTIAQHARDFAALVEHLDTGPVHVSGTSTGGAIAQLMALDHPARVRSVTMASSFARPDSYMRRQFALRRKLMIDADARSIFDCNALFLFSPLYASRNPERVAAWIDRGAAELPERDIALKRIDMIMAHNAYSRLSAIRQPTLIICGDCDLCTPLHISEEIAAAMPHATLDVVRGSGHFIHLEQEDRFVEAVGTFIDRA
jgi:aminoacrylate hydrolase